MKLPKVISLFSGAGGLDLGFSQADYEIVFALDKSEDAIRTHRKNFKSTESMTADLSKANPQDIVKQISTSIDIGEDVGIIGGPPCQGFSRANVASNPNDPRNNLPFVYLDIIEELQKQHAVKFVIFENVQGILDAKHAQTYNAIIDRFHRLNLYESVEKYCAQNFGVPQNRTRVIIAAFDSPESAKHFKPAQIKIEEPLTVRNAIYGLPEPVFWERGLTPDKIPFHPNHWTMVPRSKKFLEPDKEKPSGRCFRRLEWDAPSPTVAYGHREIHVHPEGKRRLSIYEAMILQGFPSDFILEGTLSSQVEQVSNAVPPPLGKALALAITATLNKAGRG